MTDHGLQEDFVIKENRGCTDVLFLLFYIAFWGLMIYIGIVGFTNGDPNRLISGYDFNGNICGQGSQSGSPYLYVISKETLKPTC